MNDLPDADHVSPYVHEYARKKLLQFSIEAIQSSMDLDQPDALDLDYTRLMMGFLLFESNPTHIAMIGLGGGSLAKFCHRHLPTSRITVVEINPHVVALRDAFLVPEDSERFCVMVGDGAEFMRSPTAPIDVLLVDGFDYDGLPEALCSQQFYDDCWDALCPGGWLVANLPAADGEALVPVERLRRTFGGRLMTVSDVGDANWIVLARKDGAAPERSPFAWRPSALRRPPAFDPVAWQSLQDALGRVAAAAQADQAPGW